MIEWVAGLLSSSYNPILKTHKKDEVLDLSAVVAEGSNPNTSRGSPLYIYFHGGGWTLLNSKVSFGESQPGQGRADVFRGG